jgi:putative ABC transport system permease protein
VEEQVKADYVLAPAGSFAPLPPATAESLASLEGVTVTPVRGAAVEVEGSRATLSGADLSAIDQAYDFRWTAGSPADLRAAGLTGAGRGTSAQPAPAALDTGFASDLGLVLGSRFTAVGEFGERLELQVAALHDSSPLQPLLGQILVSQNTFDAGFSEPRDLYAFVTAAGGPNAETTARLEEALSRYPGAELRTTTEFAAQRQAQLEPVLTMLYALLAFSVVVSFFGMVNALALAVYERTRELGLLRAVGMTPWQARQMIALESVLTSLLGVLTGVSLGALLGVLVSAALADQGLSVSVPAAPLLVFALAGLVVGVLAAAFPARRAARLDVLHALQYE